MSRGTISTRPPRTPNVNDGRWAEPRGQHSAYLRRPLLALVSTGVLSNSLTKLSCDQLPHPPFERQVIPKDISCSDSYGWRIGLSGKKLILIGKKRDSPAGVKKDNLAITADLPVFDLANQSCHSFP